METKKAEPEKDFIARVLETALSVKGFSIIAALFGIAVLINFVSKFGLSLVTLAVAIIGALVIAFLYLVFSWAVGTKDEHRNWPALILIWAVTVLVALSLCMIFSSCFFDAPLPIRSLLISKIYPDRIAVQNSNGTSSTPNIDRTATAPSAPVVPKFETREISEVVIPSGKKETFVLEEKLGGEVSIGGWPPNYAGGTVKMDVNLDVKVRELKPKGFSVYLVGSATFEELGGDGTKLHTKIDQKLMEFPSATELEVSSENPSGSLSWSEGAGNSKDDPPKQFSSGLPHKGAPASGLVEMWRVYVHNAKVEVTFKEILVKGAEKIQID